MKLDRIMVPEKGPVHVYLPDMWSGGVQVYLHGWSRQTPTTEWYVDEVVATMPIASSWRDAKSESILIIPQTRTGKKTSVRWKTLQELLEACDQRLVEAGAEIMESDVHIISHSGGYVNTAMWLHDDRIKRISLLDSFYGEFDKFQKWYRGDGIRRLDLACCRNKKAPHRNSAKLVSEEPEYHCIQQPVDELTDFRLRYLPMRVGHMSWVKDSRLLRMFFV